MEIIKNYLDSMFATLPNTAAVVKAKSELLAMMEDKYNELIAEGQTENAAVGTVISEFGNLDELAMDLGITSEINSDTAKEMADRRLITMDEAKEYVATEAKTGMYIGIGVLLCITCVIGPIFTDVFKISDMLGVTVMFSMIAAAVGLFVYNGTKHNKWKFIKKTPCRIDVQTADYIAGERSKYDKTYALRVALGVILCSICWLPAALSDEILPNSVSDIGAVFLFIMVGIGVFLFIYSGSIKGSYDTLLNLNDADSVSGNFDRQEIIWINTPVKLIMELFWPVVTSFYLIDSFLSFEWWRTWIIWPVAGLIHFVLKKLLSTNNE